MNRGVKTIIYPVKDIGRAKSFFRDLLETDPYADAPYYVGFKVGGGEIGLDPNGHKAGVTAYYHVDDIRMRLQSLLNAGAQIQQEIKDVGGGKLTAIVKDESGNILGLIQSE